MDAADPDPPALLGLARFAKYALDDGETPLAPCGEVAERLKHRTQMRHTVTVS